MTINPDAAISRADLLRRLHDLEQQVKSLQTARRGEAMSVGRGGIRVQGGRLLAQDLAGERVFEVTTVPPTIFMREELISQLALEILGKAIRSAEITDEVINGDTSGAFVELTGGPEITGVEIGPSGRALVIASAGLAAAPTGENGEVTCYMSYAISGATDVAASTATSVELEYARGDGTVTLHPRSHISASRMSLADNLNEGSHTFTAQYRVDAGGFDEGSFFSRNLTVIPF